LASFDALKFVYKDMLVKTVKNTVASTLSGLTTIFTEQAIQETVGGIAIGYSLGTLIAKVAANTGDISSDLSRLQANSYLAEGFYNELLESAEALKSNPTYENASYFCQAFTSYKSIQVTSWEILVKYATDKNDALAVKIFHKDKYVDDISSMQTSCNYAKSVFCHGYNHQVAQKTVVVECPVNVTILNSYGDTVAYLTDDGATVSDENISAVVIDQKKIITMPCTDEYQIVIDAYDSGTMTYTVLEYNELAENIKSIVFEDIGLMEADRFTGSINAECLTAEINYALTKNDVETIEADYSQLHEVTGLEFEDGEVQIVFGTQCRLNPVIYPSDVENTSCIWTSSDENVLKVDSEGNITTLSLGTAQVKAVTCDGGFTDTIWITVLPCDDHIFGEYEIIKNATCTEDGERQRICTVCGYTEVSKIDAEHNYVAQVTAPGCTTEGYTMHTCSVCGYSYIDSKVSALGHSFTNYISDNNATCTKDGTKTAKCDRCEITNTVTDNDSMLEHKESEWIIDKKSGCTETGSKHTQCTVCGKTIQTQIIPAAGHKFVEETVAPTCEKDGSVMRCCTVCGAYETVEVLPATGHSDENHDGICDNCGLNISISENCTCMCHKTGFMGFIYKIIRIFWKLFKVNKTCACGAVHY
ncbi:MAG: Ig domain-containing protein, partial [Acutalibacteraceae bacterium]